MQRRASPSFSRPPARCNAVERAYASLSFIGHTTDSLCSVDLLRCESIALRSYWVLVVRGVPLGGESSDFTDRGNQDVPHVPSSHPFVERLIGTVRREFLDQVPFWNACDLERTFSEFQVYYNAISSS